MLYIYIGFACYNIVVDIYMHNIGLDQGWEACENVINGFILEHWS
jgi:hypothetical protein